MTTTTLSSAHPSTGTPAARASLVERAAAIGPHLAEHATRHDAEGSFVAEAYQALRDAGLFRAAVPVELGGDGATITELAALQRELAHHCGSTALASSMHQHVVAFTAWRYRRGLPGAEATLRKVADDGILLVSTGGGDFTHPRGDAVRVEGGYRVSGRKRFASQSGHASVMSTMFTLDDPERGRRVLNMAIPFSADGVTVVDTWDALGMRGTASHDVVLDDVLVPEASVLADRPFGVVDPPLQVIASVAFPIISGAYLGVAESAYSAAVAAAAHRRDDPLVQRTIGLMRNRLQVAQWALDGALAVVGDDPAPSHERFLAAMAAKAEVVRAGTEVCDLAMDVAGGAAYFRGSVIERAYRDIRAAAFHPLTPEATHVEAGRQALGVPGLLRYPQARPPGRSARAPGGRRARPWPLEAAAIGGEAGGMPTTMTNSAPAASRTAEPAARQRIARATGAVYLAFFAAGIAGTVVVRGRLFADGDPQATLANLLAHDTLARTGVVLEMTIVLCQVLTAMGLYRLFHRVDALTSGALAGFAMINAVGMLGSAAALGTAHAVATDAAPAAAAGRAAAVQQWYLLSDQWWKVAALFFGAWLIPMGLLVLRSGWFPRLLGWTLLVGGVCYGLSAVAAYLVGDTAAQLLTVPSIVGEVWMAGHLLVLGVRPRAGGPTAA